MAMFKRLGDELLQVKEIAFKKEKHDFIKGKKSYSTQKETGLIFFITNVIIIQLNLHKFSFKNYICKLNYKDINKPNSDFNNQKIDCF